MSQDNIYIDEYEYYEALYDPSWTAPAAKQPKRDPKYRSKRSRSEILSELTDDLSDVELGFETTYRPSRHEEGWLLSSLHSFYDEGMITDVLALIKGGKEASVYLCRANPATGLDLLAAKVYRPRMFRNLRNDAMYRRGREVLTAQGRPAGKQAGTFARAIRNKTSFGMQAAHTSWLMHEFMALERLHAVGAAVPRPVSSSDNALLMSYHGEQNIAAPTLNTVALEQEEAERLFQEVLRNVDLMLQQDLIHGDLSAYNILYWRAEGGPGQTARGQIVMIDFPQVVNLHSNPKADFILRRDIQRVCEYFSSQGVGCDPEMVFDRLWGCYVQEPDPEDLAADWSRLEEAMAG